MLAPKLPPLFWEEITTSDGDFLDICWAGRPDSHTTLAILTGLEGSVTSHYVRSAIQTALEQDWQIVVLHYRSCSGRINHLPRSYHAAETGDVKHFLSYINYRRPDSRKLLLGFSLGGILSIKTLRQIGACYIEKAAVVSVPFDLKRSLQSTHSLYVTRFVHSFKKKLVAKKTAGQNIGLTLKQIAGIKNFQDFDRLITVPTFGYRNTDHYYTAGTCIDDLQHVATPMLVINSEDDPLVPADSIPDASVFASNTKVHISQHGGHLGFIHKSDSALFPDSDWISTQIVTFFGAE
jgi:uncharacterized protein